MFYESLSVFQIGIPSKVMYYVHYSDVMRAARRLKSLALFVLVHINENVKASHHKGDSNTETVFDKLNRL